MKEKRIDYYDLMNLKDNIAAEFVLKQTLRSSGFDFTKPIIRFDDYPKQQIVFQQKD